MFARSGNASDDNPRAKGKGPAWMGSASRGGPRRPTPQWKPGAPKPLDPEARQRTVRAAVAIVAALLLAGFVYYLITRPEPTPLVALYAGPYPLQMPPLAFAEEDVELLSKISKQNVRVLPVEFRASNTAAEQFAKALKAAGSQFNPFRRGTNVVLVYVAAHGMVDEQGRLCLVPPAGNPLASDSWLPLTNLLTAIREERSLQGRKKLVVLDCQRVDSCWRAGWLENRFHDELAAAVSAEKDPELFVLSSAGPGQSALAAPELNGSLFGHFAARGLRGEGSRGKGAVSLAEWFRFVGRQVDQYAQRRRGMRQQPTLWHLDRALSVDPQGAIVDQHKRADLDDFSLAYIDRWQRSTALTDSKTSAQPLAEARRLLGDGAAKSGQPGGSRNSLYQVWRRYHDRRRTSASADDRRTLPACVVDPIAWTSIQQRLAAVGERLLAGKQYQGDALETEIARLAKELGDDSAWMPDGMLPQLDWLQTAAEAREANSTAAGDNLFLAYLKAEPEKKATVVPRTTTRARLIHDVYAVLTDPPAGEARATLPAAMEFLKLAPLPQSALDLVEAQFLTLLVRGLPAQAPLTSQQLAAALAARQTAERASNPADLRVHYLIESAVNAADQKRRQSEDLLFLEGQESRGETLRGQALGEAAGDDGYRAAMRRGETIARYLRLRDEVWSDAPLFAEWHSASARLGKKTAALPALGDLLAATVRLDGALERLLLAREDQTTLTARLADCETEFQTLDQGFSAVREEFEDVYDLSVNKDQAYARPADFRDAEMILRWPPLALNFGPLVERYLRSLEQLPPLPDAVAGGAASEAAEPALAAAAGPVGQTERYHFFQELHRLLNYEFIVPYDQYRHISPWDDKQNADAIFRTSHADRAPTWQQLNHLLDAYNEAIKSQSPSWDDTRRALAASTSLRQWDRRVRVAAPWLCSFQPTLAPPAKATHPTPARWLQQYDAAHLAAWHAYRALGDFWGNGLPAANAALPYFAEAIDQCDSVLPATLRPIRYDVPGGSVANFSERGAAALSALSQWNPIEFPRLLRVSAGADDPSFELLVRPPGDTLKNIRLPSGEAALSLVPHATAAGPPPRIAFDAAGQKSTQGVEISPSEPAPVRFTAYVQSAAESNVAGGSPADARLWFRGHVRSKPCPSVDGPPQFIHYEFIRPRYPAPTVEVRGKDSPRGAILFVFDGSTSMQGWGFENARGQLVEVLRTLSRSAGSALKVGLMAYGQRTRAAAGYYRSDRRREQGENGLSEIGLEQRRLNPNFASQHPHPDGDVQTLTPLATGTADAALAAVQAMKSEECVGVTPLYYSIRLAIEAVVKDARNEPARRIIVISDGVNMPYDTSHDNRTNNYFLGPTGQAVNQADFNDLNRALESSSSSVQVSVQMFGSRNTDFEKEQYLSLKRLDARHANFEVVDVPDPANIAQSIFDSLPKTRIELASLAPPAAVQTLAFNQPQPIKDWGTDGVLRAELEKAIVRLRLPGENRTLERELALLGGERAVLQYDLREGQLTFSDDELTVQRESSEAGAPRVADPRKLRFDVLDPERSGRDITSFRFRLRDDDSRRRFTPRPAYVWLEVRPSGAGGDASAQVFPCIDPLWQESINLPRLQMPVEHWPLAPAARLRAWFRFSEPKANSVTIPRGETGRTLSLAPDSWRIEQSGGEAGKPRKITVKWLPSEPRAGLDNLLDRAVWLWPPPDVTHRYYALDGSAAVHEFTYSRAEALGQDIELRIVKRADFQDGAYQAECDFSAAN